MATLVSDFGRFMLAVVTRWQAYITGSVFTAAAFLYEHVTGKMISAAVVLWGAAAFFVTGAFMAWREHYRSERPIEIRERLDELTRKGESLLDQWTKRHRPKIRTQVWNRAALRFVRQHFNMTENDSFKSHFLDASERIGMAMLFVDETGKQYESTMYEPAVLLKTRLVALAKLRNKIRD